MLSVVWLLHCVSHMFQSALHDNVFEHRSNYSLRVFWFVPTAGGRGNWTNEGCKVMSMNETTGEIVCRCNHLTNFAILVVRLNPFVLPVAIRGF